MNKWLILAVSLLLSGGVKANNCDIIQQLDLSKDQKVALQKQCLDATLPSKTDNVIEKVAELDVEQFRDKAQVIVESVTTVIKTTAKDLNIAVNDFVQTPVGILTTGVIVYHYVGKDFIVWIKDFIFLTLFVVIGNIMLVKLRYKFLLKSETNHTVKGFFGREKVITKKEYYTWEELYSDGAIFWFIFTVILQAIITVIYFANI